MHTIFVCSGGRSDRFPLYLKHTLLFAIASDNSLVKNSNNIFSRLGVGECPSKNSVFWATRIT